MLPLLLLLLPSQLGRHFWPSWSLVHGIRVDYLSPTLFFTDVLILIILLSSQIRPRVPLPVIIFAILNILISSFPFAAIFSWLRVLEYYWLFKYLVPRTHYPLSTIHYPLSFAVIWASALTWLQFFKQGSLGGLFYWFGERTFNISTPGIARISLAGHLLLRPYATLPHPNALAGFLLAAGLIIYYFNSQKRITFGTWSLVIAGITIPVTFSRTAALLEVLLLITWLISKIKIKTAKTIIALSACLLLFSSFALVPGNPSSFSERVFLVQKSLTLIKNHPLTGVGLGNFIPSPYSLFPTPYSLTFQPVHNIFLLLASELGIPAILFVAYWVIKLMSRLLRLADWSLVFSFLSILLTGIVDHYWLTLHQNSLLMIVLLSIIWIRLQRANEPSTY